MRSAWHRVRTGHWPEAFVYGGTRLCKICDIGTPTRERRLVVVPMGG